MANAFAVGATCCALLVSGLTAQSTSPWSPIAAPDADSLAWGEVQRDHDSTIADIEFVQIHASRFQTYADLGTPMVVDLFDLSFAMTLEEKGQQLEYTTYRGRVENQDSSIAFAVSEAGIGSGMIQLEQARYALRYTGHENVHAVFRIDLSESHAHSSCGTDHTHVVTSTRTEEDKAIAANVNLDGVNPTLIDVGVFYTPNAQSVSGGPVAMGSTVAGAIASANFAAQDSGIDHVLRMVYVGLTQYNETGGSTDLSRFRGTNDGFMDEVHQTRDDYGADLMCLIIGNSGSFCGVGYLMGSNTTSFRSSAFSVTVFGCINNNTLAHEMGHTMGCAHDRQNAGGALFSYSYGYRTQGNEFRSIMSYSPGTRVNLWSTPNATYGGLTMGTSTENNARSLDNVKDTVANFKTQTLYWWQNVGGGITRPGGKPKLNGSGSVNGVDPSEITISSTLPGAPGVLFISNSALFTPLLGGTLVPNPIASVPVTGSFFSQTIPLPGLNGITPPLQLYWQLWFADAGGPSGFTASDGLCVDAL